MISLASRLQVKSISSLCMPLASLVRTKSLRALLQTRLESDDCTFAARRCELDWNRFAFANIHLSLCLACAQASPSGQVPWFLSGHLVQYMLLKSNLHGTAERLQFECSIAGHDTPAAKLVGTICPTVRVWKSPAGKHSYAAAMGRTMLEVLTRFNRHRFQSE